MVTRVVRDGETHKISVVESDNRDELHHMVHDDIELGRLMSDNNIREMTGYSSNQMRRDLNDYEEAEKKSTSTSYDEMDRKHFEERADEIRKKYEF